MAANPKGKQKQPAPKPKTKEAKPGENNRKVIIGVGLAVLLALTYFLYSPATGYGFTNWDDDLYVTENPLLAHPENTHDMFTTPVAGHYHPLTIYSLAYDYQQVKALPEEQQAHRFHTVSILLHLFNTILAFFFVYLLTNRRLLTSFCCAALFALHPMHVESVAWIAERKDVVYTFFFFISLVAYLLYLDKKNYVWLAGCFVAFVLSVSGKSAAVILPLVLLCIDYFKNRDWNVKTLAEKIPFFIISAIAGYFTVIGQRSAGAMAGDQVIYTMGQRLLFPFYGVMMYWIKLVWPFQLSAVYPYPNVEGKPIGFEFYLAPLVVTLTVGAILYFGRGKKIITFGALFFFINVILVLQFLGVGQAIIAERYTYVAYLGPFLMMSWWLDDEQTKSNKALYYSICGGLVLLLLVCIAQTKERVKVWGSNETLWTDVINQFPNRITDAYNNRGYYYRHAGQLQKALDDYAVALSLNSKEPLAWSNRGNVYFDLQQFDSAIANYNRALALRKDMWETFSNRGASRAQVGDLQGAVNDLELSTQHDANTSSLTNLALVYSMLNEHEKAITTYQKVMELAPGSHNILNAIGTEYQKLGKFSESLIPFTKAIQINPNEGFYYLNRSYSYHGMGDVQHTLQDVQTAQRLGQKVREEYAKQLGN